MVAATAAAAPARVRSRPRARGRWLGGPGCLDPHEPRRVPGGHRRATGGARLDGCLPGRPARLRPASWDADQERAARAQVDQKHAGHVGLVTRQATMRGLVDAMFGYRPIDTLAAVPARLLVLVAGCRDRGRRGGSRARARPDRTSWTARAGAGLSAARVVRLPGTGHNLMRYRPGALSAELLALPEPDVPRPARTVALGCAGA